MPSSCSSHQLCQPVCVQPEHSSTLSSSDLQLCEPSVPATTLLPNLYLIYRVMLMLEGIREPWICSLSWMPGNCLTVCGAAVMLREGRELAIGSQSGPVGPLAPPYYSASSQGLTGSAPHISHLNICSWVCPSLFSLNICDWVCPSHLSLNICG